MALPEVEQPAVESLALTASFGALNQSGVSAADIGLLTHSRIFDPTPDDCTTAPRLARLLGAKHAVALGVRQMSNGGAIALQFAVAQMLAEIRLTHSLVVTADVHGPEAVWGWMPETGTPLGDAATAVLLTRDPGALSIRSIASCSVTEEEANWAARDPVASVTTAANIFRVRRCVRTAVEMVFADADIEPDDPRLSMVVGPRLRPAFIEAMFHGLLPAAEYVDLSGQSGHLFAGDLAANLNYLRTERRPAPGEYALIVNIGVGFTVTMLLVRGEREE
ncbi:hypothetical protein [Nocardia alni]|uniref:hypothetical protein n=1 Tax=Nocardia alni TaxID=2815723 RepID=UPI0027DF64E8|nr:hypothetical protein [Nocardia alni]